MEMSWLKTFHYLEALDPPNRIMEPRTTHEFEITYAPEVDYLLGDEWRLIIAYAAAGDAATATNLTTELIVARRHTRTFRPHSAGTVHAFRMSPPLWSEHAFKWVTKAEMSAL